MYCVLENTSSYCLPNPAYSNFWWPSVCKEHVKELYHVSWRQKHHMCFSQHIYKSAFPQGIDLVSCHQFQCWSLLWKCTLKLRSSSKKKLRLGRKPQTKGKTLTLVLKEPLSPACQKRPYVPGCLDANHTAPSRSLQTGQVQVYWHTLHHTWDLTF